MANIQNFYDYELTYTGKYINEFLGTNAIDTVDYYDDLKNPSKVSDARITGYETEEKIGQEIIFPEHSKIFYVINDGRINENGDIVDVNGVETTEDIDGEEVEVIKYKRGFYQFIGYWEPAKNTQDVSFTLDRHWKYIEELSDGGKVFKGTYLAPEKVGKIVKDQDIGNKSAKTIIQLMFSNLILTVPKFTTNFKLSTFPSKMYIGKSSSFEGKFTIGSYTNGSYGNDIITAKITNLQISLSETETVNKPFTFTPITISFTPKGTSTEKQEVQKITYSGTPSYTPSYTTTSSDFGKKISFKLSGSLTYTNPQTNKSVTETISSTITSTVYQYYYYGYSESSTDTDFSSWQTKSFNSSSAFSSLTTENVSFGNTNKYLMIAIPESMGGSDNMSTLKMTPTSGGISASMKDYYVGSKTLENSDDTYYIYRSANANSSWEAYNITK